MGFRKLNTYWGPPTGPRVQLTQAYTRYPLLVDDSTNDPWNKCTAGDVVGVVPDGNGQIDAKFIHRYIDAVGTERTTTKKWGWKPDCGCKCACGIGIELDLGNIAFDDQAGTTFNYTKFDYDEIDCSGTLDWSSPDYYRKYIAFWGFSDSPNCELGFYVVFGDSGLTSSDPRLTVIHNEKLYYTQDSGGGETNLDVDNSGNFTPEIPAGDWYYAVISSFAPVQSWPGEFITSFNPGSTGRTSMTHPAGELIAAHSLS